MASILSALTPYLPQHEGILPKWLLFISIVSIGNSIQAYNTLHFNSQVYLGPKPVPGSAYQTHSQLSPVTPLSSRTFGTWTLIQSIVRLYAAYYIDNPQIYQLAFLTYAVAWGHFMSEWFVFKSARMGRGLFFPVLVANGTLIWMLMQWRFYVPS